MTPLTELSVNGQGLQHAIEQYERRLIQSALAANTGHKGRTAAQLCVDPKTLYRKMKLYGIR
jgi:DNA-binding NtrC family response regulator